MVPLLDVNTLVALAWPNHVHHRAAHRWFGARSDSSWATCPLTQSGFVRVSASPRATSEARSPQECVLLLRRILALPGHQFWTDDISLAGETKLNLELLVGYRQVTDAHLLALAIRRGGCLATFDRGLRHLLPADGASEHLLILGSD